MDAPQLFFSLTESNNKQWFNISIHCEILSDSKISDEYCPWPGFLRASLACYGLIAWRKYHAIFRKTVRSWRQNLTQPKVFFLSVVHCGSYYCLLCGGQLHLSPCYQMLFCPKITHAPSAPHYFLELCQSNEMECPFGLFDTYQAFNMYCSQSRMKISLTFILQTRKLIWQRI